MRVARPSKSPHSRPFGSVTGPLSLGPALCGRMRRSPVPSGARDSVPSCPERPPILEREAKLPLLVVLGRAEWRLVRRVEGLEVVLGIESLVLCEGELAPVETGPGICRGGPRRQQVLLALVESREHHFRSGMGVSRAICEAEEVRSEDV